LRLEGFPERGAFLSRGLPGVPHSIELVRNDDGSGYFKILERGRHDGKLVQPYVPNRINMVPTLEISNKLVAESLGMTSAEGRDAFSQLNSTLQFNRRGGHLKFTHCNLPGDKGTPTVLEYDSGLGKFAYSATFCHAEGYVKGGRMIKAPIVGEWTIDLSELRPEALHRISHHDGEQLVLRPEDWVSLFLHRRGSVADILDSGRDPISKLATD